MLSTTPGRLRLSATALLVVLTLGAVGCQPADDPAVLEGPGEAGSEDAARAPGPPTLDEVMAETDAVAAEWQDDARPVEAIVHVTPQQPVRARVTYLAPEADRFLTVEIGEQGPTQERPTLATLGLGSIDAEGLEAVPSLPSQARDADVLAEAAGPVLEGCGFDTAVDTVLYASGAPAAWDGQRWAGDLEWTATVRSTDGGAVALDPVDAAPEGDPCVARPGESDDPEGG